uniref:Uncharacterized protein n=1 Tax=Anguilla anguilla TaxID=7936 RepID=A0A0E9PV86_ANGAN
MSLLRVFTNPRNHMCKGVLVESVFKGEYNKIGKKEKCTPFNLS